MEMDIALGIAVAVGSNDIWKGISGNDGILLSFSESHYRKLTRSQLGSPNRSVSYRIGPYHVIVVRDRRSGGN